MAPTKPSIKVCWQNGDNISSSSEDGDVVDRKREISESDSF